DSRLFPTFSRQGVYSQITAQRGGWPLAIQALARYWGMEPSLDNRVLRIGPVLQYPLDWKHRFVIDFPALYHGMDHLYQQAGLSAFDFLDLEDLDEDEIDELRQWVENRIVILGDVSRVSFAQFQTPVGVYYGTELVAASLHTLMSGSILRPATLEMEAILVAIMIVAVLVIGTLSKLLWRILFALVPLLFFIVAAVAGYIYLDMVFPMAGGLVFGALYLLMVNMIKYRQLARQKSWIQNAFSSYVSPNLVKHLIAHPDHLALGGEFRECTFIMTDLAGFTSLMEKHDPQAMVALLNTYLDRMVRIAFSHDGTLDRIVGDAVCIMFSAPVKQVDHGRRALTCALEMHQFAQQFSQEQRAAGIPFGHTRIGVHTGRVLVGNFGGGAIYDYRAFGDPINTSARLESANRYLGTRICVSDATVRLSPDFQGRPVGTLLLKGKSKGLTVFEPFPADEVPDAAFLAGYREAFRMMESSDPAALDAFAGLVKDFPDDPLCRFHHQRLLNGEQGISITMAGK
ncbi:MAG: CHASE2 domain-containing protein, partial [Magnetococcales bacterium]|nr:CHASE2 domain-containing protein [Magnetococcales bacterium]